MAKKKISKKSVKKIIKKKQRIGKNLPRENINIGKIKKFFKILSVVQPSSGKDIGLIVVKDETLADISSAAPNSNLVRIIDLNEEPSPEKVINDLSESLKKKLTVIIRLHNYLHPQIYNQLYLISNSGRMEFFDFKKETIFDVPKESQIIIVSTDKELEKLNYKDFLNVIGPVLRLS